MNETLETIQYRRETRTRRNRRCCDRSTDQRFVGRSRPRSDQIPPNREILGFFPLLGSKKFLFSPTPQRPSPLWPSPRTSKPVSEGPDLLWEFPEFRTGTSALYSVVRGNSRLLLLTNQGDLDCLIPFFFKTFLPFPLTWPASPRTETPAWVAKFLTGATLFYHTRGPRVRYVKGSLLHPLFFFPRTESVPVLCSPRRAKFCRLKPRLESRRPLFGGFPWVPDPPENSLSG